jgi:hypothetical protein
VIPRRPRIPTIPGTPTRKIAICIIIKAGPPQDRRDIRRDPSRPIFGEQLCPCRPSRFALHSAGVSQDSGDDFTSCALAPATSQCSPQSAAPMPDVSWARPPSSAVLVVTGFTHPSYVF